MAKPSQPSQPPKPPKPSKPSQPSKAQVLLKVKAVLADPSGGGKPGQKVHLLVTAHRLWIAEGREMPLADLASVQFADPQTVNVQRIGRAKASRFRCRSRDEARRLKACLVFQARSTRGGLPGVGEWRQLLSATYDRMDVSDTAVPSAPVKPESIVGPAVGGRSARKLVIAVVAAVVIIAGGGVLVYSLRGNGGPDYAALRQKGDQAYKAGDHAAALQSYLAALPGFLRDGELNGRIGRCQVRLGKYKEAIDYLKRAVKSDGGQDPGSSLMLAEAYQKTRRLDRALTILRKARGSFPGNLDVESRLAAALNGKGKVMAALRFAQRVYRRRPEDEGNKRLYAALLERAGRHGQAADIYLAMARQKPGYDIYVKAIRAAARGGNLRRSERIIELARRDLPENALLGRSNTDILISLGLMKRPEPEPAPEPEPEPEPTPQPQVEPTPEPQPGTSPLLPEGQPEAEPGPQGEPEPAPPAPEEPSLEQPAEEPVEEPAEEPEAPPEEPADQVQPEEPQPEYPR
ncbi:MAG: tetratricopeptide repeat protein [Anaerolineaceae bacterium]|nr:tetratricopeptide repeat protein [Anaerolineaceae bacterium]